MFAILALLYRGGSSSVHIFSSSDGQLLLQRLFLRLYSLCWSSAITMWASDTMTSLAKPSSPRAFNASNAAPSAYTVTDASNGWPIVFFCLTSKFQCFCTDVRKSNNWFHLSSQFLVEVFRMTLWPILKHNGFRHAFFFRHVFQTSSAVKENTGDTIATNVFKISYIAVWAERRATLFFFQHT